MLAQLKTIAVVCSMNQTPVIYNQQHIDLIKAGKVVSLVERSQFSSVPMFKAFEHKDLDLNKHIAIVTYQGLTNYANMDRAVFNGVEGIDYYLYDDSIEALSKMNEIALTIN